LAYGLTAYDAGQLTESKEKADYFERSLSAVDTIRTIKLPPKLVANWINGELSAELNSANLDFATIPITADKFAKILVRVQDGTISQKSAKDVLVDMWTADQDADAIIEKRGLRQISDAGAIEKLVDEVLAANEKQVADYRAGKEKAFNSLVGQVMKRSQGKANPAQVNEVLRRKLKG